MAAFTYHAVTPAGKRIRGSEDSSSAKALTSSLTTRGLIVLDVTAGQTTVEASKGGFHIRRTQGVLEMTRAMAALLPAGLPLSRSLTAVANLTTGGLSSALGAVRTAVTTAVGNDASVFGALRQSLIFQMLLGGGLSGGGNSTTMLVLVLALSGGGAGGIFG